MNYQVYGMNKQFRGMHFVGNYHTISPHHALHYAEEELSKRRGLQQAFVDSKITTLTVKGFEEEAWCAFVPDSDIQMSERARKAWEEHDREVARRSDSSVQPESTTASNP